MCLIEAGPSDVGDDNILVLSEWMHLLDSVTTGTIPSNRRSAATRSCGTPGPRCSAAARRTTRASRSGRPPNVWTSGSTMGADGWGAAEVAAARPAADGDGLLRDVPPDDPCGAAVLEAAADGRPADGGVQPRRDRPQRRGLVPDQRRRGRHRNSSSHAYLHPILGPRKNLEVRTECWVAEILFDEALRATGVRYQRPDLTGYDTVLGAPRGDRHRRRDRHPEVVDALRNRPDRAPARDRHRRARRFTRRRIQPRRPRRRPGVLGGVEADGDDVDAVVGDRPVHHRRRGRAPSPT